MVCNESGGVSGHIAESYVSHNTSSFGLKEHINKKRLVWFSSDVDIKLKPI